MIVEYLITLKTLTIKKTKKELTEIRNIFFVKFQAPFSQKIINIQLCISFKVQMKCFFFLLLNLKEQQKSGRSPFTVS